ncbi:hypothetical protein [Methylacidimicrobium tartarophylax]|uniref:hypothetical protein n=1 Tax=Methylacidimicrobium tartarophylax TaxID=1041768 RepID=UPI001158049E|nr:hypothetical protein [Methylacidimicrobium tartarophylax]
MPRYTQAHSAWPLPSVRGSPALRARRASSISFVISASRKWILSIGLLRLLTAAAMLFPVPDARISDRVVLSDPAGVSSAHRLL